MMKNTKLWQLCINVEAESIIFIYIDLSICNKTTFLPILSLVFSHYQQSSTMLTSLVLIPMLSK
jgi:hypothetical protein